MEIHLKIIGGLLIVLASVHIIFPKYFQWDKELNTLSLVNQQIMKIHTFFIALTVLLMGVLCISNASGLVSTQLGNTICLGLGIFWGIRLLVQFFGYSSKLWRGKIFETSIHIIFSLLWAYLTFIFLKIGLVL